MADDHGKHTLCRAINISGGGGLNQSPRPLNTAMGSDGGVAAGIFVSYTSHTYSKLFYMRSKADGSQLDLPHGTKNGKK